MKKTTLNEEVANIRYMMLGLQKPITEAGEGREIPKVDFPEPDAEMEMGDLDTEAKTTTTDAVDDWMNGLPADINVYPYDDNEIKLTGTINGKFVKKYFKISAGSPDITTIDIPVESCYIWKGNKGATFVSDAGTWKVTTAKLALDTAAMAKHGLHVTYEDCNFLGACSTLKIKVDLEENSTVRRGLLKGLENGSDFKIGSNVFLTSS